MTQGAHGGTTDQSKDCVVNLDLQVRIKKPPDHSRIVVGIATEQSEDIGQDIYLGERLKQPPDIVFQALVSQDCPGHGDRDPHLPRLKKAPDKFAKVVFLDRVQHTPVIFVLVKIVRVVCYGKYHQDDQGHGLYMTCKE